MLTDINPKNIQAMAAGTSPARYGYEVPATTTTTDGSLSGSDKAGIITAALGAIGGIVDSLKGLWSGNGSSGNDASLQTYNLATLGNNNRSNNTWIWVAGATVVVGLVVFLALRKKR